MGTGNHGHYLANTFTGASSVGFNYLFIFPPSYVALCGSKARHRLGSESVSWCLETSLFFKTAFLGWSSVPTSFVSFCLLYFSYLHSKKMGCFSGCLMSSAGIQKLFCGIYSAFKCFFDEFVGEKVISPFYSSTILGSPPQVQFLLGELRATGCRSTKPEHHNS